MIKQKAGCIINVSSLMATKGGKGASVYAASKAGMLGECIPSTQQAAYIEGIFVFRMSSISIANLAACESPKEQKQASNCDVIYTGLTQALALELGRFGVRVNALVPGYIQTEMIQSKSKASSGHTRSLPQINISVIQIAATRGCSLAS